MTEEPIAIVGAGAVFPGAGSAAELWRNVLAGFDAITDVPPERWDPALYYDPAEYGRAPQDDRFYCRRGGFVDDVATFDPARFGIEPAAVAGMEPDRLLALRTAAEAIADAGGDDRLPDRERVGVVLGRGDHGTPLMARADQRVRTSHQLTAVLAELLPELGTERLAEIRRAFCARLGPDGPDAPAGSPAAGIADRFDLRGPAYTLDAACASALLAVEHAVRTLRRGEADAMLAGAVHVGHQATVWSAFSRLRALSRSETIRPFDRAADGTLLAEGTGVVLLKRLSDAERAGDRVHAVIIGVGSASDGRAAGILNPLVDGQVRAVERAWRDAGLDPAAAGAVGLIEAHGTATPAGDEAELAALRRVFGTDGPPIGLGTVKSMIGHALPAAGIAGLIKAAFALRDGMLPPTLHVDDPHPALDGGRLRPVREPAEWADPEDGTPRRAVVNAFGFGGANAHVILQEAPSGRAPRARRARIEPPGAEERVLRIAARTTDELAEALSAPDDELLAHTSRDVPDLPCRVAIVAPTSRRLDLARAVVQRGTPWRGRSDVWFAPRPLLADGGRLAFLFPGLEPAFDPRVADVAAHFGLPEPELTGDVTDVVAVGRLLAAALAELGIEPDVTAGHGPGEWAAMITAGMCDAPPDLPAADGPHLVYGALGCGAARAEEAVGSSPGVYVSHDNCPHQSMICGPAGDVRDVLERLASEGVLGRELPLRTGLHTPHAEPLAERLRDAFEDLRIGEPRVPVWSATTAAPFPRTPDAARDLAVRHLLEPVRFSELIEELYGTAHVRAFVQVGPGGLTGFVDDRLGDREHLAMAVNVPNRDGMAQLRRVVAALWAEGYGASPPAPPRDGMRLDLGAPLVRLDGAVPPVRLASRLPPLPSDDPIVAELEALLNDAAAGAQSVVDALGTDPSADPDADGPPAPDPGRAGTGAPFAHGAPFEAPDATWGASSGGAGPDAGAGSSGNVASFGADSSGGGPLSEEAGPFEDGASFGGVVPDAESGPSGGVGPSADAGALDAAAAGAAPDLVVSRVFSLETMPYLEDHCVVPQAPGWPDMSDRLPVVPIGTLLEVMADTARELLPGRLVVGFEDVRAVRWVVADPPTTADVRAFLPADAPRGVHRVKIVIAGHAAGTVLLGARHTEPPCPDGTPLTVENPPIVTAGRLYEERWMFHGPLFRGIAEITALAEDGARGVLTSMPAPGALVESAGQLCAHWMQVYGDTDQTVFPVGIDRLSLYGPLPPAGEHLEATVWNTSLTDSTMCCDVELVRPDGTVWGRIDGWTTRRFYTDEALWRMKFTPEVSGTGEPQPGGWCLARRRWRGNASRDLLMRRYLCAAERAEYERLPAFARGPWLLGRIAAKDAVRDRLWRDGHGPLFPAELVVDDGDAVTGPFDEPLTVRIASDAELGVALVRPGGAPAGIGLAVHDGDGRIRAAKQAVRRSLPAADRSELVVAASDSHRLLVAGDGTLTTVETREIDGHVVAWTVADDAPNNMEECTA